MEPLYIFWVAIALSAGVLGDRKGRHGGLWFLYCSIFPPLSLVLLALEPKPKPRTLVQMLSGETPAPAHKTCPMCAEQVLAAAKICKHCRHDFQVQPVSPTEAEQVIS
ncbi:MAG: hypothetical protein IT566_17315 [Rhodospirillaceae bacterium]|nr:hypothetical protein [Rhodospirillaceae bacterium]